MTDRRNRDGSNAGDLNAASACERLADHFAERLVELWHGTDDPATSPASLAEWMGLTDEQYSAWVECRYDEVLS